MLFIDRSLASKRLPEMLERMGFEVERHKDHFVHDEDDDKWIPPVSSRQWVILTGDKGLAKLPVNVEAVRVSKAQVLVVSDTNSLPEQWASAVIVGRQRIQELLDKHPGPVFIHIGKFAKDHINRNRDVLLERKPDAEDKKADGKTATVAPTDASTSELLASANGYAEGQGVAQVVEETSSEQRGPAPE